jgi:hypothetical protein
MRKKAWIVWSWSRAGALMVFMVLMIVFLSSVGFVTTSLSSVTANMLTRDFRNLILDVDGAFPGMTLEYSFPAFLEGREYLVEVMKSGEYNGIVAHFTHNPSLRGAASFSGKLTNSSYGVMNTAGEESYMCIVSLQDGVALQRSKC